MTKQKLRVLSKQLFSLALATALTLAILAVPAQASQKNAKTTITGFNEAILQGSKEEYTFDDAVRDYEDLPFLEKGNMSINSAPSSEYYYRIDADAFIGNAESAYFMTHNNGNTGVEICLYGYITEGKTGEWKEIKTEYDGGKRADRQLLYKLKKGEKYILGVIPFIPSEYFAIELVTEDVKEVTGITDLGTVHSQYLEYGCSDIYVELTFVDGTKKVVKGAYDCSGLDLYVKQDDDGHCRIYCHNDFLLAGGADILPITLKPENDVRYEELSDLPHYQLGSTLTVPANSRQLVSIDIPECVRMRFDGDLDMVLHTEDDYDMDFDYYPPYDEDKTGILYKFGKRFANKKGFIIITNPYEYDVTGQIWKTDPEDQVLQPQSIALNKTNLSLKTGEQTRLFPIITPESAENKSVTWTSSNPAVAKVDGYGNVTATAAGTTDITVTTVNGKTASCKVTVTAADVGPQPPIEEHPAPGSRVTIGKKTYKVKKKFQLTLIKSKEAHKAVVPETEIIEGSKYTVTAIGSKAFSKSKAKTVVIGKKVNKISSRAFAGSKVKKIIIKTKKLSAKSLKKTLKNSKIKTVQIKVGNKKENKKFAKKYKIGTFE